MAYFRRPLVRGRRGYRQQASRAGGGAHRPPSVGAAQGRGDTVRHARALHRQQGQHSCGKPIS
eukprot:7253140-Prymnesium_polylepis.1